VVLAWFGAYWLLGWVLPGVPAVLNATLLVGVAAMVLKDSFTK